MDLVEEDHVGPWSLQRVPNPHAGGRPLYEIRLSHDQVSAPVLVVGGGAQAVESATFATPDSLDLVFTSVAGGGHVSVCIDLTCGVWTCAADRGPHECTRLQDRYGTPGASVAPWPVAAPTSGPVVDEVRTRDGRWSFALTPSATWETDAGGRHRPHYYARLIRLADGAELVDTRVTGHLAWLTDGVLQLRRSPRDEPWLAVSLAQATFCLECPREYISFPAPLEDLPRALGATEPPV